jgi:uncharacterized protein YjbJ (UPF0337 family)
MTPENEKTVAEQMVEGAQNQESIAEKMSSGTRKDTARAVNEPPLQSEGKVDKAKGTVHVPIGDGKEAVKHEADRTGR